MLATVFTNSVAGAHAFATTLPPISGACLAARATAAALNPSYHASAQGNKSTSKAYMTRTVRCGAK